MNDSSRLCSASFSIIQSGVKLLSFEKCRYEYTAMYCQEILFADGNINTKRLTTQCDIEELRCHLTSSSFSKWHVLVKCPESWRALIYFFFSMLDDHHWHTGMSSANDDYVRGKEAMSKSSTGEIATVCIMKRFFTIKVAEHRKGTQRVSRYPWRYSKLKKGLSNLL